MRTVNGELKGALRDASKRLLSKAALSAITIPVVVLVLFSLTIFRFTSRQYMAFLWSVIAIVIPMVFIFAFTYMSRQRRLLRRLGSWYAVERDPGSQADRALAVRLQKELVASSYEHAAFVGMGIFLSLALGVLVFGRYADFTAYTSVAYISLGALVALVDFFVTLFISHSEMRPVLRVFLADCQASATIPRRG